MHFMLRFEPKAGPFAVDHADLGVLEHLDDELGPPDQPDQDSNCSQGTCGHDLGHENNLTFELMGFLPGQRLRMAMSAPYSKALEFTIQRADVMTQRAVRACG